MLLLAWSRLRVSAVLIILVMVTAADRAAATCAGLDNSTKEEGRNDLTIDLAFLSQDILQDTAPSRAPQKAPSTEGAVSQRLTEDPPYLARPRRLCQPPWTQPTSKKPRPPRMGAQLQKSIQVYPQPLFGREREGGASLREAASLAYPRRPLISSGGGPGEALLYREAASPGVLTPPLSSILRSRFRGRIGE